MQNGHSWAPEIKDCDFWNVRSFLRKSDIFWKNKNQHRHFGLSFLENLTFYWEKSASPILSVIFDQLKNPAKNVRLRILKLVKPDICLKTDNINYVPLNPFLCFVESNSEICFLVFIWCRPVVRVWPPLCPTTTNSPSALLHLQHHQINPQQRGWLKKGWRKNIKLFNVLNSLISSSDNHHEKISH